MLKRSRFKTVMSHTLGFGPFTFFGKELFADSAAVRLYRRLQALGAGRAVLSTALDWIASSGPCDQDLIDDVPCFSRAAAIKRSHGFLAA